MNVITHHLQTVRFFMIVHKKVIILSTAVMVVAVFIAAVLLYNAFPPAPKVVYQPVKACDVFTIAEAHQLLGVDVIGNVTDPTLAGHVAVSKCSYTDTNPNENGMIMAAVALQSAVDDKGVQQNKKTFADNKSVSDGETIPNIGDAAFFNHKLGQLNILKGRQWMIISYGIGTEPQSNTVEDAVKLARLIVK